MHPTSLSSLAKESASSVSNFKVISFWPGVRPSRSMSPRESPSEPLPTLHNCLDWLCSPWYFYSVLLGVVSSLTCFISSSSVSPGVRGVVLKLDAKISSWGPVSKDFTNVFWISERAQLKLQPDSCLAKFTLLRRSKEWSRNCCGDSLLCWCL